MCPYDKSTSTPKSSALPEHGPRKVVPRLSELRGRLSELQAKAGAPIEKTQSADSVRTGIMSLVAHLRRDNIRLRQDNMQLREALNGVQPEAEAIAVEPSNEVQSVDFGHLLSLVKEFGDDLQGIEDLGGVVSDNATEENPATWQSFSISSPRGNASSIADAEELARLRAELARSQQEVAKLRKQLVAREEKTNSKS